MLVPMTRIPLSSLVSPFDRRFINHKCERDTRKGPLGVTFGTLVPRQGFPVYLQERTYVSLDAQVRSVPEPEVRMLPSVHGPSDEGFDRCHLGMARPVHDVKATTGDRDVRHLHEAPVRKFGSHQQ